MDRADNLRIKQMNKQLLRDCFVRHTLQMAGELSGATGLSVVTVNALLKEMIQSGEVVKSEEKLSRGGRPGVVYRYNTLYRCAVIIYGLQKNKRDYIKCMVTDMVGNPLYEDERTPPLVTEQLLEELLDEAIARYPAVQVAAFGLPGEEEDQIITINDYKEIIGSDFLLRFAKKHHIQVIFLNDINAAVRGMYELRKAKEDCGTIAGIFYPGGYPPGMGLVINGRIHTGRANFAGEISYAPLGIQWPEMDYDDQEAVAATVAQMLAVVSAVLAPDLFILYGEFINDKAAAAIRQSAERMLRGRFKINLILSHEFQLDFEWGMICSALEILNKTGES